jgi:ribonuclease HI
MIVVHFDGLCEPRNPGGVATYGFVVYVNGSRVHQGFGVVGEGEGMSNNVAEFSGLIAALDWLLENGHANEKIVVRGDSQLVINLMNGVWTARGGMYYPHYLKARELASKFSHITFEWVPRSKNEEADSLSRKAYEEYCRSHNRQVKYTKSKAGTYLFSSNTSADGRKTCTTCKWVVFRGPHVGCFYNGEYRKWLSKKFAKSNACENYEAKA